MAFTVRHTPSDPARQVAESVAYKLGITASADLVPDPDYPFDSVVRVGLDGRMVGQVTWDSSRPRDLEQVTYQLVTAAHIAERGLYGKPKTFYRHGEGTAAASDAENQVGVRKTMLDLGVEAPAFRKGMRRKGS